MGHPKPHILNRRAAPSKRACDAPYTMSPSRALVTRDAPMAIQRQLNVTLTWIRRQIAISASWANIELRIGTVISK